LHRLEQYGTSGWLHVPTFGGGTIRTEFEVLTGQSLRYFPQVQFPYLQINQKAVPGIVRLLAGEGYTTLAVHGNNPGFWNRTTAFKELGFDKFISIADFPPGDSINDGKYMSDKSFTDELLRQLPIAGPPRFVLGISIEAHGPYDQGYGIDEKARDAIPVPAAITDAQPKMELQNYIYHMQHADQQLGRLVDTLAQRKRRTVILFFGDHLPALVPAFQQAGFQNGGGFLTQTVPYILIDTAHMDRAVKRDAAAWELPGMVLAQAGIDNDPYFALTRLVAPELANLTRAPDAPVAPENVEQKQLDEGMRNIAELRLKNKLDGLWAKAAAMAQQNSTSTAAAPVAHGMR
ncbi:MAG: LTA synthase family protein, partial [Rhodanobacteraceae bacterium]